METGPSIYVTVRDGLLLAGGLLGIGYQTISSDVNPVLTGAFMAMLGLPGVGGIISAVKGSTTSSSSSPPSHSSSSPSSSSTEA